eukprot:COSAG05_NODE_960_length_6421_cov_17.990668_1_plen_191_part_00
MLGRRTPDPACGDNSSAAEQFLPIAHDETMHSPPSHSVPARTHYTAWLLRVSIRQWGDFTRGQVKLREKWSPNKPQRNSTDEQFSEPDPEPELQPEPVITTPTPLRILQSSSSSSSEEELQEEDRGAAPESIRRGPVPLLHRPPVTSPPPILPATTLPTGREEQRERPPERLLDSPLDTAVSPISVNALQ